MKEQEGKLESPDKMTELERKKMELVLLRIRNGFYDNEAVLEQVADEILQKKPFDKPADK
jgi:hypothetical protein